MCPSQHEVNAFCFFDTLVRARNCNALFKSMSDRRQCLNEKLHETNAGWLLELSLLTKNSICSLTGFPVSKGVCAASKKTPLVLFKITTASNY